MTKIINEENEMHEQYLSSSLALFHKVKPWIVALFLSLFGVVANAAIINITLSNSNPLVGETIGVNFDISGLSASPGDSLSGFDLDILFDDNIFSFMGFSFMDPVTSSNQLDLPEVGKLPFFGEVNISSSGVLDAFSVSGNSAAVLDAAQVNNFRFLGLIFTAIAEAPSSTISIDLSDTNLLFLDSSFGDLSVSYSATAVNLSVSSEVSVPEPNSIFLLAAGLPLLLAKIRKNNGMTRG